ncbi:MAG: asparagine--tRNA ligase [Phycisphaerales bacterium]|nr:asparagine--tRNA ligase [Phycisphaerales bacterium]
MPDLHTYTPIVDAFKTQPGTRLTLKGWVRTRRDSKVGLSFIQLSDGSCFDAIQIVAPADLPNYTDVVLSLTTGCAIAATGTLAQSQGKGQDVELQAESIELIGGIENPDTYPVPQKRHTFEYLREVAHLRPRTNTFGAVARVRHCLSYHIHRFLHERGFYYVHTPIITASDAEGAGEMFRVSTLDLVNLPHTEEGGVDFSDDFFGREAFLTVSGQLSVETYCCALSKVYTFGPTFRAENSNTSRHLSEFWMIEPEIAFCDLAGSIELAEAMLKDLFRTVLDERADDMAFFNLRIDKTVIETLQHIIDSPFVRITYTDAVEELRKAKKKWEFEPRWGADLHSEHERYLTEVVHKTPVVVTDYPKGIKAFYMRLNDDEKTVAAMDILVPKIGEIVGGSQREERLDVLDRRITEMRLPIEAYWWYRDLRRYGTVPHAGYGLGFGRLVQFTTGMANIRDVIPFPRTPRNAEF